MSKDYDKLKYEAIIHAAEYAKVNALVVNDVLKALHDHAVDNKLHDSRRIIRTYIDALNKE